MSATLASVLALLCSAGGENRLWFVDVELRGACDEVRLDCGPDGETRLLGPFAPGEDRRASVPVPVRSPLGSAGLASVPLPSARVVPEGAAATVEVRGWSAVQPAAELEVLGPLLSRPRPPVHPARARAGWPELVLAGIAGAFLVRLRRRALLALALASATGAATLELARSRRGVAAGVHVVEWDVEAAAALSVRAGADEIPLPRAWLEVAPEGRTLALDWRATGTGAVRAPGGRLAALAATAPPPLTPAANGYESLVEVWTRTAGGLWSSRGPWPAGKPLGPLRESDSLDASPDPPGWLASGIVPGRPVLLARTESGTWLRCLGFESE